MFKEGLTRFATY